MHRNKTHTGFTIVELLIVVVVIAILAAITLVAYNGIRERTIISQVQSGLSQANKKILAYAALNGDQFPVDLAAAGVNNTESTAYQYTSDNTGTPSYALTASNGVAGAVNFYISSGQSSITSGIAPGHNLISWREPQAETSPVILDPAVTINTAESRSGPASIRLATGATNKRLRGDPYMGQAGQTVTVSLWLKSEAGWNGLGNNSKIRFGTAAGGSLVKACGYNGVKLDWTFVSCDVTLTADNLGVTVSVGNDGTVGAIWLDDISVSIR